MTPITYKCRMFSGILLYHVIIKVPKRKRLQVASLIFQRSNHSLSRHPGQQGLLEHIIKRWRRNAASSVTLLTPPPTGFSFQ